MKKTIMTFIIGVVFTACSSIYPWDTGETGNQESKKSSETKKSKEYVGKKTDLTYQEEVLRLVNIEREKKGLKKLTLDKKLSSLSVERANDMAEHNYFSHNSKRLGTPFEHMKKNGVKYRTGAENIAKGQKTPEAVVKTWMESTGHRQNILNPKFHKMGIGKDELGKNIWVELFTGE